MIMMTAAATQVQMLLPVIGMLHAHSTFVKLAKAAWQAGRMEVLLACDGAHMLLSLGCGSLLCCNA